MELFQELKLTLVEFWKTDFWFVILDLFTLKFRKESENTPTKKISVFFGHKYSRQIEDSTARGYVLGILSKKIAGI